MPKFIITERVPATLVWRYEIEADNETDALEQVIDGKIEVTEHTTEDIFYEDTAYEINEVDEEAE